MILVTGAAGYIGSHFVRKYLSSVPDGRVLAIDNLSAGHVESLPTTDRVTFHQLNVGDKDALTELMRKHEVKAVVHFAASIFVGESQKDPFKYFNNNLGQSMALLEAMNAANVKKIVFSSTCATYGDPQQVPMTESHPQVPINAYGHTKYMVEQMLYSLHETLGFSFFALRYFNAAGADDNGEIGESHDPETHLIPNVFRALNGKLDCLEVYGDDYDTRDGTCIRDYIHVYDLASAHIAALKALDSSTFAEGINLGTGYGASVKEIIDACNEVAGKKAPMKMYPRRFGDAPVLVADYAKAKQILGWTPQYDLKTIIQSAWNWELNRRY